MQVSTEGEHNNESCDLAGTEQCHRGDGTKQKYLTKDIDSKKTKISNKIKLPPSKSRVVKCYYCSKKFIHQNLKTHILSKHGNVTIREKGRKSLKDLFSSTGSEKKGF